MPEKLGNFETNDKDKEIEIADFADSLGFLAMMAKAARGSRKPKDLEEAEEHLRVRMQEAEERFGRLEGSQIPALKDLLKIFKNIAALLEAGRKAAGMAAEQVPPPAPAAPEPAAAAERKELSEEEFRRTPAYIAWAYLYLTEPDEMKDENAATAADAVRAEMQLYKDGSKKLNGKALGIGVADLDKPLDSVDDITERVKLLGLEPEKEAAYLQHILHGTPLPPEPAVVEAVPPSPAPAVTAPAAAEKDPAKLFGGVSAQSVTSPAEKVPASEPRETKGEEFAPYWVYKDLSGKGMPVRLMEASFPDIPGMPSQTVMIPKGIAVEDRAGREKTYRILHDMVKANGGMEPEVFLDDGSKLAFAYDRSTAPDNKITIGRSAAVNTLTKGDDAIPQASADKFFSLLEDAESRDLTNDEQEFVSRIGRLFLKKAHLSIRGVLLRQALLNRWNGESNVPDAVPAEPKPPKLPMGGKPTETENIPAADKAGGTAEKSEPVEAGKAENMKVAAAAGEIGDILRRDRLTQEAFEALCKKYSADPLAAARAAFLRFSFPKLVRNGGLAKRIAESYFSEPTELVDNLNIASFEFRNGEEKSWFYSFMRRIDMLHASAGAFSYLDAEPGTAIAPPPERDADAPAPAAAIEVAEPSKTVPSEGELPNGAHFEIKENGAALSIGIPEGATITESLEQFLITHPKFIARFQGGARPDQAGEAVRRWFESYAKSRGYRARDFGRFNAKSERLTLDFSGGKVTVAENFPRGLIKRAA